MRRLLFAIVSGLLALSHESAPFVNAQGIGSLGGRPGAGNSEEAATPPAKSDADKERQQAFAWIDGLGFPDVKHLKFVRIQIGSIENPAGDTVSVYKYGFLLEDRGANFKVFDLDLATVVHERSTPDTPPSQRVDIEPMELLKFIGSDVPQSLANESNLIRFRGNEGTVSVSMETRYLFLAWVCAKRGAKDASDRLFDKAGKTRSEALRSSYYDPRFGNLEYSSSPFGNSDKSISKLSLQERVAESLSSVETARALVALRDPKVSRAQVLQQLERVVRLFPGCRNYSQVCDLAVQIGMMVDEDRLHALQRHRRPLAQLSERERLAELVYQLRDQPGVSDEMGMGDILSDPKSPAGQLVARGYAAVPLLLEHLSDRRLTRAPQKYYATEPLLTVGDCAEMILAQISGLGFDQNERYGRHMLERGSYAQLLNEAARLEISLPRAVFTAWYSELKKQGEKRLLSEATAQGDYDSLELGRRLLQRFPNDALPPLISAARTGGQDLRQPFVELIRLIPSGDATAFLLKEVREGPFRSQIVAAEALLERKRPEALTAMIAEWRDENPLLYGDSEEVRAAKRNIIRVVAFLIDTGHPEAIAALARDLRKRPVDLRIEVIGMLRWAIPGDEKFTAAVEDLLIACLDDAEERRAWTYQSDFLSLADPRVCDVAAGVLSDTWPEKYSYDLGVLQVRRDRQLVELKNVWREAHKMPPLPVSVSRARTVVVSEKAVRPHLEKFLVYPKERALAQAEIEKLGVGAFWPVLDFRDGLSRKEYFELVDGLARKLACTVVEIEFAPASLEPDAALRERFAALANKPFDRKSFFQAMEATAKTLPEDIHGVDFNARRTGDNTGFVLTIDLLSRQRATYKGRSTSYREAVVLAGGGVVFVGRGGGGSFHVAPESPEEIALRYMKTNQAEKKKLVYSGRICVGATVSNQQRMTHLGGGQYLAHSEGGEFILSSSWSPAQLATSLDEALNLDPGISIDVNVRFTRTWHPPSGGRYADR